MLPSSCCVTPPPLYLRSFPEGGIVRAAILNVTGYAGVELARILHHHPHAKVVSVTGRSEAGKRLGEVFPHLSSMDLVIQKEVTESVDVIFSALPHKASAEACAPFLRQGVKVVDISADFRLRNVAEFEAWYDVQHPCPEYLEEAVYGLPELYKDEMVSARLVANPGCYPTSAILALAPVVQAGLVYPDFVVDSKSGVSGAGRGMSLFTHFSEVNENVQAYSIDGHRHLPEIVQELKRLNPATEPKVTFLPHLIPMTRGILSSCYASLKDGALAPGVKGIGQLRDLYRDFYKDEPFVKVVDTPPQTKHTLGNNDCILYPTVDQRTNRLLVISCLDNLVKGAAGQAIQNMNLMFGIPETEGVEALALYP
ncbi:MAG: N-acetyl-gamma-glutamyl-phosphate reductase [Chloroflexi bacterium]|nr:N-acetyl-gamma-glutamyl-phosphate reductase [Chloroflexota bacterium]